MSIPSVCPRCLAPIANHGQCPICGAPLTPGTADMTHINHAGDAPANLVRNGLGRTGFSGHRRLVLFIKGAAAPLSLEPQQEIRLGRLDREKGTVPELDLGPYHAREKGVSRLHATLRQAGETLEIIDLASANGTFLNENRLTPNVPYRVGNGDLIRLGTLAMHLYFARD
ncbi:MAG: FHA domain-containing protein [Anaerolineae bacterium]|nr:FHA domain-containing protein [Anaerolineae bacterium]